MKTRIRKIIIMAVALFFVSVSLSFAHDVKVNSKRAPGNAYGHYKKGYDYHPGLHKKHYKQKRHFGERYYKNRRHYSERYRYREVHKVRHHYHQYDRHAPRRRNIIGLRLNEPGFKFAVVVKNRR
jgi:hypothetical protein